MRRHPGIAFDVWEIIATYKAQGESWDELKHSYPWLSEAQLRAALSYYQAYPEEIDRRLALEAGWTEEAIYDRYPALRPR